MKLFGALAVFFAMAVLMPGAGEGPDAIYVGHDKVAAAIAKGGGPLVTNANMTVVIAARTTVSIPEIHQKMTHIYYVLEGSGVYVTGGNLIGGKVTKTGTTQGTNIEGGNRQQMTKGDVIVIPPGTPHWWKEISEPLTLYAVSTTE